MGGPERARLSEELLVLTQAEESLRVAIPSDDETAERIAAGLAAVRQRRDRIEGQLRARGDRQVSTEAQAPRPTPPDS